MSNQDKIITLRNKRNELIEKIYNGPKWEGNNIRNLQIVTSILANKIGELTK